MRRIALAIAGLLISTCAFAQSARDQAHAEFAGDLAELQAAVNAANTTWPRTQGMPLIGGLAEAKVTRQVTARELPSVNAAAARTLSGGSEVQVLGATDGWANVMIEEAGEADAVWVQSDALVVSGPAAGTAPSGGMLESVISKARQIVDSYRTNPYVEVSGFSTTLSLTGLSLSVQFKLK